ncbi:WXG100 family type VII secretion target [Branchiibius hedensis]|uniref:ESAT-6-like protein n=1 Tax=Branchiibius hedensis TaxID=672460 RepID=A0A2Y8ZSE6_9MICO|nr:WXG100 family type VII secretion target [Branchiibius hedensis]PWJ26479.1 WXG100 family type VII secretion target [Branchiibius hedensis]SSA35291.1 WXG100 family type VII secretion target [Branchiibius hedensis]
MSNTFAVNTTEIARHSSDLNLIAGQIQDAMGAMRRKLEVLQGTWTGSASGQYAALQHEWEGQQENVRRTLESISGALGRAGSSYQQTEQDVLATFRH